MPNDLLNFLNVLKITDLVIFLKLKLLIKKIKLK